MASLEKDVSNQPSAPSDAQKETNAYDDEINLMDYFFVIWKQKWFIFLASVLPALVVGLLLFFGPKDYTTSYIYNTGLGEKDFKILEDKFYSTENLEKLIEQLQASDLKAYANNIAVAANIEVLRELVSFEVLPAYFEAIQLSNAKNIDEFEKFQQAKGTLLVMQVTTQSKDHIREIALVCRNNFEQIMPLYSVREELNTKIIGFKEEMADIEEARYELNQQLERKKYTLEQLKKSGSKDLEKLPSDITLQFSDVGKNSDFLPLAYQIQAADTKIITLQEQIRANKEKYEYYTALLKLNEKLLSYVEKLMPSYYTIGQLHLFLTETSTQYKEDQQHLQDYLKAYIKRIENKIAAVIPLVEKPKVHSISNKVFKKSALVFVAALMMSMFTALLFEGLKKYQV